MNKILKSWLPDVVAIALFAVIAFAYFYPAITEGRILYQHDTSAGVGAGEEQKEYLERTGERTRWTNALFSGMPTYQLAPSYDSTSTLSTVEKAYHLWLPDGVWYLFAYLLGFYILLRAFNFKQYLAALGSIVWAFSTYFLIIIAAGHIWKVMALAYLPPLIAGIVLAYRGRYLAGLAVTAIFAALEIHANHVQMTYYYLFIILFMVIAYAVEALRKPTPSPSPKEGSAAPRGWKHFLTATAVCLVGGMLGVLVNLSNIYHTWEYSQQTMRGGTELTKGDGQASTSGGLDRDYITQWSYGIDETWTLLVPNTKGGASGRISTDQELMEHYANPQAMQFFRDVFQMNPYQNFNTYWGTQPFTAGPVYVGAFVLTLFILGLFIVKGPMKWALLAATVLSILLSWGKNFMGLTDLFIDYMPMYAKFRTVSSILVVAEFTIPLLAMLALKKIIDEPEVLTRQLKWVYTSVALTGGLALLFALLPDVFFDLTSTDAQTIGYMNAQIEPMLAGYPDMLAQYHAATGGLADSLHQMRVHVFTADCWRSVIIIVVGTLLLLLYRMKRLKALPLVGLLAVLCLADLWQVNKRYLNDAMFQEPDIRTKAHAIKPVNERILQDKDLDYRVLNLISDTFNENETSYYHKSIGGYHAAKLGRYNELISAYIQPEKDALIEALQTVGPDLDSIPGRQLFPVINMLNARYFIVSDQLPLRNPYAQGNAWFADRMQYVADANEELAALAAVDLRHEAVADRRFEAVLGKGLPLDSAATVTLDAYEPNRLTYTVDSSTGGVLVFSEIYYPGWTATIDGQPAELGRVNYVLRALRIGSGRHQVELSFFPQTVKTTETIAYVALIMTLLVIVATIVLGLKRKKQ